MQQTFQLFRNILDSWIFTCSPDTCRYKIYDFCKHRKYPLLFTTSRNLTTQEYLKTKQCCLWELSLHFQKGIQYIPTLLYMLHPILSHFRDLKVCASVHPVAKCLLGHCVWKDWCFFPQQKLLGHLVVCNSLTGWFGFWLVLPATYSTYIKVNVFKNIF